MIRLYKIMDRAQWDHAEAEQRVPWTAMDLEDGFVHLSSSNQVVDTAHRHFGDAVDLVLIEIDAAALVHDTLRWEASHDDEAYPHVYGDIPLDAVVSVDTLVGPEPGRFSFPARL